MLSAIYCALAGSLLALAATTTRAPAQGLPPVIPPFENPITPAKTLLGKALFWDEQLSSDGTVACGSCHQPRAGGADPRIGRHPGPDSMFNTPDDVLGSPGIVRSRADGTYEPALHFGLRVQVTGRVAPTNIGAAYFQALRWDGLAGETFIDPQTQQVRIMLGAALESHAAGPPVVDVEMAYAQRSWNDVAARIAAVRPLRLATNLTPDLVAGLAGVADYGELVRRAFGDPAVTAQRIIYALATYQRALVPDQSPWDRFVAGNSAALTPDEQAGLALFQGAARCAQCHTPPLFSDQSFRNLGLRPASEDIGWQLVTHDPSDRGKFKAPTLRNASLRSRFMHTGEFRTVAEVVDFYDRGGGTYTDNKDPFLRPLGLTATEKANLVAFVTHGLLDPRVAAETTPFDRPILHAERAAAPFGDALAGSGNLAPRPLADAPLHRGNTSFRLGIADALGPSTAILALGFGRAPGQRIGNLPVNLALSPAPLTLIVPLAGSGVGAGHATLRFPLPPDPNLIGLGLYHQWFVADPAAPGGVAASQGTGGLVF